MKISVLTPSYNSSKYLGRAIESVISQDYPYTEHIVVDGGSNDGTIEILKKYPGVTWISEKDNGQSDAMNKAFNISTGNIIVYLNADDYFEPGIFNFVAEKFNELPQVDILIGDLVEEWENENIKLPMVFASEYKKILLHFRYGFPYNPVCYFYRRNVQEKTGAFPVNEHFAMDFWFLLNALREYTVLRVHKVFGVFYKTGLNKTSNSDNLKTCRKVALDHCHKYGGGLLAYYKINYFLFRLKGIISQYKKPIKWLMYYFFFSKKMTREEYIHHGYKKSRELNK